MKDEQECRGSAAFGELNEPIIAARLRRYPEFKYQSHFPEEVLETQMRPAAVLVAFTCIEDRWHILFIHRSEIEGDRHGGQVAFPGGAAEPGDEDVYTTALREAEEEVGLRPQDVRVLGRMSEFITITSYSVTPVVAVFDWPYTFRLQKGEVERAFTIPFDWLADENNYYLEMRTLPPPYDPVEVIYYEPYDGEVLWGASARMTLTLLEMLKVSGP